MEKMNIAIDGPASAGKSTVAKKLAAELSYVYCDTGAMYRALTYAALSEGLSLDNEEDLLHLLQQCVITFQFQKDGQRVFLNGKDVTKAIRENEVTRNVSLVSSYKTIREELVDRQKKIAASGGVVMDGRDIGTVVLPDAEVKIFMIASVEERAQRRFKENQQKGIPCELEQLQKEIERRDYLDSTRENSPLIQAKDAILLDTTGLSIEQVVKEIKKHVEEKQKVRIK